MSRRVRARLRGFADRASGNCVLRCLNSGIHAVACPGVELAGIHASHPAGLILRRAPLLEGLEERASAQLQRNDVPYFLALSIR